MLLVLLDWGAAVVLTVLSTQGHSSDTVSFACFPLVHPSSSFSLPVHRNHCLDSRQSEQHHGNKHSHSRSGSCSTLSVCNAGKFWSRAVRQGNGAVRTDAVIRPCLVLAARVPWTWAAGTLVHLFLAHLPSVRRRAVTGKSAWFVQALPSVLARETLALVHCVYLAMESFKPDWTQTQVAAFAILTISSVPAGGAAALVHFVFFFPATNSTHRACNTPS